MQPSIRATLESLSRLIDDHLVWQACWTHAVFFPGDGPKPEFPQGLHDWVWAPSRHPVIDQPAVMRLVELHDVAQSRAMEMMLRATLAEAPLAADHLAAVRAMSALIEALRRVERVLLVAAYGVDDRTGLRAQTTLMEEVGSRVVAFARDGRPFCLAVAEIDRQRKLIQRHGQAVVEQVLSALAVRFQGFLGGRDDAWRAGATSVALILDAANLAQAVLRLNDMRQEILVTPIPLSDGGVIRTTLSFGVMEVAADLTAADLCEAAREACTRAQSLGGNRIMLSRLDVEGAAGEPLEGAASPDPDPVAGDDKPGYSPAAVGGDCFPLP